MKDGVMIIVVDGQPGGGKDEFLRRLGADPWFGRHALVMGEAAQQITLQYGINREEKLYWGPDMWVAFQRAIVENYRFTLAIATGRAVREGKKVIFLNRFMPSGAAYLPGGLVELSRVADVPLGKMIEGVDHVICPGPPPEWAYVRHAEDDPGGFRFEPYKLACELGAKARRAYIDLGFVPGDRLHDIPGGEDFDEKCAHFMRVARQLAGARY